MRCNMSRSSHLLERIAGGLVLVALSLTLALAGCEETPDVRNPNDPVNVEVDAPGVDVDVEKPREVD
jgi:hypothetical protein